MRGQLGVKLHCPVVKALPGSRGDFLPQLGDAAFENDFGRVRQIPGGGEAVVSGGLHATVLEKGTGIFPLFFALFLLFSLGELGITRGVICGSLGLVSSSSPGLVICCSLGGAMDSAVWTGDCSSRTAMQKSRS